MNIADYVSDHNKEKNGENIVIGIPKQSYKQKHQNIWADYSNIKKVESCP